MRAEVNCSRVEVFGFIIAMIRITWRGKSGCRVHNRQLESIWDTTVTIKCTMTYFLQICRFDTIDKLDAIDKSDKIEQFDRSHILHYTYGL